MQIHDLKKDLPIAGEIHSASDRSAAIVATSWLDTKLTTAIKSRLLRDKNITDKLLRPGKPIGALGTKIDLGFLLNLYSSETRDDLERLSSIRNKFAHWDDPTTFGTREIRLLCEELTLPRRVWGVIPSFEFPTSPYKPEEARKQFLETISLTCSALVHAATYPDQRPMF